MAASDDAVDILLVDDQPSSLLALEATLEQLGQRLHRATSGREALRLMLDHDFAVILLDVVMPDMDGLETARMIRDRERSAHTPIIFLTGLNTSEPPLLQAYALGAVDYLVKPFVPAILRSKVAIFVELARQRKQMEAGAAALAEAQRHEHERQLLQRQLDLDLDQQRWLESVLDLMPTPLVLLSPDPPGTVFANWAANALAGGAFTGRQPLPTDYSFTDAAGAPLTAQQLPNYLAAHGQRLTALEIGFKGPDKEGTVLAHSERLAALYGHRETVMLTLIDITELKHTQARLQDAVRASEDFLAVASHELRTPLTALRIQVSNALRKWSRPPPGTSQVEQSIGYLHQIDNSVGRLVRLSDYLLDVSRVSAGNLVLQRAPVQLGELVTEVVQRMEPEAAAAACPVTLTIAGPPATGSWDRPRLDQAITNLLSNALKYAPGAPLELSVSVGADAARLVVRDHGPGIGPEHLPTLFAKFDRADAPEDGKGFGLGLWIVDQIVSHHGGQVSVESVFGQGATFTLRLPLALSAPAEQPQSSTRAPTDRDLTSSLVVAAEPS